MSYITSSLHALASEQEVASLAVAATDSSRVRLEGVHAVKHAVRFGARLAPVVSPAPRRALELLEELAPDVMLPDLREVGRDTWRRLAPQGLPSPLLAACRRPKVDPVRALGRDGPALLVEDPTHAGNLGAVVRVAAAAGAAVVLSSGDLDPWRPDVVRAAAGLHLAVPVARVMVAGAIRAARRAGRRVVALDPAGDARLDDLDAGGALLVLGTERHGISAEVRDVADRLVRIPMRDGVSSLNLATAAAIACFAASGGRTQTPW